MSQFRAEASESSSIYETSEMRRIKVLIIDDSALTRSVLRQIINSDDELEVVGTAVDPLVAAKRIQLLHPDVITLDLEMPRMDGLTFLKKLNASSPTPVIIISGNSPKSSRAAIEALDQGAIEIIEKPDISTPEKLAEVAFEICMAIKAAAEASLKRYEVNIGKKIFLSPINKSESNVSGECSKSFYVIGSSTGGPDALRQIFESLHSCSGIVVAQHMPAMFTKSFAERINSISALQVKEASNGDYIRNNQALIIPGDYHGIIRQDEKGYCVLLTRHEKVNRHRPSVDVLFESAADVAGARVTGILLTGMGDDGAKGLLKIMIKGGRTIAQSASSCIVFGMPRRAIELGAANKVLSPSEIIKEIMNNN
jgi:two-component system, chemotaxis family, protein-glutamate methylesterase/glutaminase